MRAGRHDASTARSTISRCGVGSFVAISPKYRHPIGPGAHRKSSVPTALLWPSKTVYRPTGIRRWYPRQSSSMRYQAADADITTNAMPTNAFDATPPFCRPAAEELDRINMEDQRRRCEPVEDGRQVQRSDRLQPEEVHRDAEEHAPITP
jgi:hypothetical protein